MDDWRWGIDGESARSVECPYCMAAVGQMCVTSSGQVSSSYHADRFVVNTTPSSPICRYCRRPQHEHSGPEQLECP